MSAFKREDSRGEIKLTSDRDITLESDRDMDGAGDIVFRTGGVERARINAAGVGSGWPAVLGGSVFASAPSGDTTGATDNAVLQAAITAAASAGKALVLREGTYYFTGLTFPSNFEMYGAGRASVLKLAATGAANHPFCNNDFTNGNSSIHLHDFTIDGNQANISGNSLVLAAPFEALCFQGGDSLPCTDIRVERLYVHDSKRLGIVLTNVQGGYVKDCFVDNNQRDGITLYYNCSNVAVTGNRIRNCGDDHIGVNSENGSTTGHACTDILVANNLILGPSPLNRGAGVTVRGGTRINVSNNVIDSVCEGGVQVYDYNTTAASQVTVSGNTIRRCGYNGTSGKNGVIVDANNANNHASSTYASITDVEIVGNNIADCLAEGIALRSNHNVEFELAHVKIASNKVSGCTSGILLSNTGIITDVQMIGNDCKGNYAAGIIGIGTLKRIMCVGNQAYNNVDYGIRLENVVTGVFTGNLAYDGQAVATQAVGIRLATWTGTCFIQGNSAVGNTTAQYSYASMNSSNHQAAFFNKAPTGLPVVTGSRAGGAALASLMTGLVSLGLVSDTSTVDTAYRRIYSGKGRLDALVAQTIGLNEAAANGPSGSSGGANVFYFDPADWPSNVVLRVGAEVLTNDVAPVCTFTVGLYPITATGGGAAAVTATLGTVTASSTAAVATPALDTRTRAVSADFTPPAAGFYAIAVVVSANMAASSSVFVRGTLDAKF